jgi:hypothetical protein
MFKALTFTQSFGIFENPIAGRKKMALAKPARKTRLYVAYALIACNAVLLLLYFFSVNSYAGEGYDIKKVQNEITQLTAQSQKLSLAVSEQTSVVSMQVNLASLNFVPVGTPKFLQSSQSSQFSER